MTAVTYIAKRSIVAGHVVNNSYSINIPVVSMPVSRQPKKNMNESLSMVRETIYHGAAELWEIQTPLLTSSQTLAMKEFLDSVEDGSAFTFDAYGSVNTPVNQVSAEIESTGYPMQREPRGQGGSNDYFRFSFTVRVVT